jgi:hypothetical protein
VTKTNSHFQCTHQSSVPYEMMYLSVVKLNYCNLLSPFVIFDLMYCIVLNYSKSPDTPNAVNGYSCEQRNLTDIVATDNTSNSVNGYSREQRNLTDIAATDRSRRLVFSLQL